MLINGLRPRRKSGAGSNDDAMKTNAGVVKISPCHKEKLFAKA